VLVVSIVPLGHTKTAWKPETVRIRPPVKCGSADVRIGKMRTKFVDTTGKKRISDACVLS